MQQLLALVMLASVSFPASALTCSFSLNDFNFGVVDVLSSANPLAQVSANATITCSRGFLEPPNSVTVCGEFGTGTGGRVGSQRTMASGANALNFNIYSDAGGTSILGASNLPQIGSPLRIVFAANNFSILGGTATQNVTLYGRVNGNQPTAAIGNYVSQWLGATNAQARYVNGTQACAAGMGTDAGLTFQAIATVTPMCLLQKPADLNFGTRSNLGTVTDATTAINLTCTRAASYSVELDRGLNNNGVNRNMRLNTGTATVNYELYRDPARSQVWRTGSNALTGTGTGVVQSLIVYGRIPTQATPAQGAFTDTVTVTVTF